MRAVNVAVATTQLAVITTLANLVGQTVERTALPNSSTTSFCSCSVKSTLAARRRQRSRRRGRDLPAMTVVGLGGDFYDVI